MFPSTSCDPNAKIITDVKEIYFKHRNNKEIRESTINEYLDNNPLTLSQRVSVSAMGVIFEELATKLDDTNFIENIKYKYGSSIEQKSEYIRAELGFHLIKLDTQVYCRHKDACIDASLDDFLPKIVENIKNSDRLPYSSLHNRFFRPADLAQAARESVLQSLVGDFCQQKEEGGSLGPLDLVKQKLVNALEIIHESKGSSNEILDLPEGYTDNQIIEAYKKELKFREHYRPKSDKSVDDRRNTMYMLRRDH